MQESNETRQCEQGPSRRRGHGDVYEAPDLLLWLQDKHSRDREVRTPGPQTKSIPVRTGDEEMKGIWKLRTTGQTLTGRLRAFFQESPDEELTPEQAAVKFDVPLKKIQGAISGLMKAGELEKVYVIRAKQKG